jgi:hypothetical protein
LTSHFSLAGVASFERVKGVFVMNNQLDLEEQTTFLLAPPEIDVVQEVATRKRIALVAHDNKKNDLLEWARYHRLLLVQHECLHRHTGRLLNVTASPVVCLQSGP